MRTALLAGSLGAGVFVAGASAGIVHFINPAPGQPGHYDWGFVAGGSTSWLNITRGPWQQTSSASGASVSQKDWASIFNLHEPDPALPGQVAQVLGLVGFVTNTVPYAYGDALVEEPLDIYWVESALHAAFFEGQPVSAFPEFEHRYIGVRTAGGNHGWIEVSRYGMSLTAFAWAYETVPGVPVYAGQIPVPGAAVVMAAGVFGVTSGRRRS